ncbi:hypothetical protein LSCM4_03851 [Leishmania orientalis]|uniref:Uncharacterized protein n=1 Tax=Leishmania orientalis TaxID=2249476 RepID=A0A836GGM0_9TRYP|nr:hypothetical protein LSCM4_03851 [Leishmania orientalis]
MKKLKCAASVSVPSHCSEGGGGHSAPAWMRKLCCVRSWIWPPVLSQAPMRSSKAFTLQVRMHRSLFLQYRCVALRATSGDAGVPADERSPWEVTFEEALYMSMAHPSLPGAADTIDAASSSDVADQSSAILAMPHREEVTSVSGAVSIDASGGRVSRSTTGTETVSVRSVAKSISSAQAPRANAGRGSGINCPPLPPPSSASEEERRVRLTAELAFEQALFGDIAGGGDEDTVATGSHSEVSPASTSTTSSTRPTGEAARGSSDGHESRTAVATGVGARAIQPSSAALLRRDGAELSIGAPPPPPAFRQKQDHRRPVLATTTTAPRVAFASAEAAFERALYGDATMEQLSGKAKALVPRDAPAAEGEMRDSTSPGTPPLPPTSSASPETRASALSHLDVDVVDVFLQRAGDTATGAAIEETPASDIRVVDVESMPQAPDGDPRVVEKATGTEPPDTVKAGGDDRVTAEAVAPPPTVSMRCAFDLKRWDAPADQFALFDALFRVTDHHTTVVTHIDPEDRVRRCMPLLDRVSKQELFFASEWLLELERVEGPNTAFPSPESAAGSLESSAAAAPTHREVVGRSKVLRTLVFRLLQAQHRWWDQVQEVVLLAVKEAEVLQRRCTAALGTAAAVEYTPRMLSAENTGGAAESVVVPPSDAAAADGVIRHVTAADVQAAMTRIFGTDPQQVHFFSDALREALIALVDTNDTISNGAGGTFPAFVGPVAAWNAFVLMQRHCTTGVCGPHTRPFSFCEGRPTITVPDLAPLRYCEAAASWCDAPGAESLPPSASALHSADVCTTDGGSGVHRAWAGQTSSRCLPSAGIAAAVDINKEWDNMSEEEQNAFLFGAESAQLSVRVRELGGVYAVFGQNNITFETENTLNEAEVAAQKCEAPENEEAAADATDADDKHAAAEASPFEVLRDQEVARVRAYNVDRVVLQLTNGEGAGGAALPSGRSTVLSNLASASPAMRGGVSRQRRGRGRIGTIADASDMPFQWQLRNNEDVQLAALWQRFIGASTGDLIGNLLYVRRHANTLVHEAVADLAVQKAFWLLFFARDEVRAITHPKRTYETLWNLHQQLVSLFALRRSDGPPPSSTPGWVAGGCQAGQTARPAFEDLSLQSQVSYACFGFAHVPPRHCESVELLRPSSSVTRTPGQGNEPSIRFEGSELSVSPADLYDAFAGSYNGRGVGETGTAAVSAPSVANSRVAFRENADFTTLSALQKLAVAFCFPCNKAERDEAALLLPRGGGTRVSAAPSATVRGTGDVEEDEESKPGGSSPASGWHAASEEKSSEHVQRTQPSAGERQQGAGISKAKAREDGSVSHDACARLVQDALEGSVYECLRSLRAAGVLAAPRLLLEHRRGDTGVSLAAFSAQQRRRVQRAVQDIAAAVIKGDTVKQPAGESPLAKEAFVPPKAKGRQHPLSPAVAAVAAVLKSPKRRGRRARVAASAPPPTATTADHLKNHPLGEGAMMASNVPLRRKRGRKPRAACLDVTSGAPEERATTAAKQTRDSGKPSMQRDMGRRGGTREAVRLESGVTDEEVASVIALFREDRT